MRIQSHFKDYYDWANPYRDTDDRAFFWKRDMSAYEINPDDIVPKKVRGGRRENGGRRWPRFEKIVYREDGSPNWEAKQVYVTVGDQTVSFYARFPESTAFHTDDTHYKLPHKAEQIGIMGQSYISPYAAIIPLPLCSTMGDFPRKEWKPSKRYAYEPNPTPGECVEDRTPNTDPQVFPTAKYPLFTMMQMRQKTPILLFRGGDHHIAVVENPCLVHYGIQNVLTNPQQVYQNLEMWFTDGKFDTDPPAPQTDIQKVVSHGFDKKKSFRNMSRD